MAYRRANRPKPGWLVEQEMAQARQRENNIEALKSSLRRDNVTLQQNQWQANASNAVYQREVARMANERETERALEIQAAFQKKKVREVEQDVLLAQKIQQRKANEVAQQARIQQIIESDDGLKQLEVQLRTAYANKERAWQLEAKAMAETVEAQCERAMDEAMERDRVAAIAADAEKARANRGKRLEIKNVLQHQISEGAARRLEDGRLEYLRDKADVDAIVARIRAEDAASDEKRARQRELTRREIQKFNEINARMKRERSEAEQAELRRIMEYQAAQDARAGEEEKKKEAKQAEEERIYQKLLSEQKAREAKAIELEELRETLSMEEGEKRRREQEEARQRKAKQDKMDMIRANERQKREKAETQARQAAEEQVLIAKMRAKFEADEAKEREQRERRRVRNLSHRAEIEKQQRHRKDMYEQCKAAELAEQEAKKEEAAFRARVIEEARKRLLREHAGKLQGYLSKGMLVTDEERAIWAGAARR